MSVATREPRLLPSHELGAVTHGRDFNLSLIGFIQKQSEADRPNLPMGDLGTGSQ